MNTDQRLDLIHADQKCAWLGRVREERISGRLAAWVSTFHPTKLTCRFEGLFFNGSYNLGQKAVFSDGTAWMVRLPIVGNVCDKLADEKVAMEVEALSLIREKTTIPVPLVQAWGLAAENHLGLGPFIMIDFIEGVPFSSLFRVNEEQRLLSEDISDSDLNFVYKQLARILLQLFKLDFDGIGSLPSPKTGFRVSARPLTFKAHDIWQTGGVDGFGDRTKGFSMTTAYLQYVFDQDWAQLLQQANSVTGPYGAEESYKSFSVLRPLIPDFVNGAYDHGRYKLFCDDFGLGNIIVRSEVDLTIVGVVDLEWSYVGPAQLFGSAPWWLLRDRLNNYDDPEKDEKARMILKRYLKSLNTFQHVLEEEENLLGQGKELSNLMNWSVESGAMWLHMILSAGFNAPKVLPFTQLIRHIGSEKWTQLKNTIPNAKEIEGFVQKKVSELDQYDMEVAEMEEARDIEN